MGGHVLLQGIFPAQGLNPGLPHCWRILYRLNHQGSQIYSTFHDIPYIYGGVLPWGHSGKESACKARDPGSYIQSHKHEDRYSFKYTWYELGVILLLSTGGGGCPWCVVGGDQSSSTPHSAQDAPHQRLVQPQMAVGQRP